MTTDTTSAGSVFEHDELCQYPEYACMCREIEQSRLGVILCNASPLGEHRCMMPAVQSLHHYNGGRYQIEYRCAAHKDSQWELAHCFKVLPLDN